MKRSWIMPIILLALALAAGCSGALPAVQEPTPTPAPLSQRDLSTLVMQSGDLGADFDNYSVHDLEGVFPEVPEAHNKVVKSTVVINKTDDSRHVFSSGIIVYEAEDQATRAYSAIKRDLQGNSATVSPLGDEHYAMTDTITSPALAHDLYLAMVIWRVKDAVIYVSSVDSDAMPTREDMESLALKVQGRISGAAQ